MCRGLLISHILYFSFFFLIFFLLAPQPLTASLSFLSFFFCFLFIFSLISSFLLFFPVIFSGRDGQFFKKKKKNSIICHQFIVGLSKKSTICRRFYFIFDKFIDFFCFHMDMYSNLDLSIIFRCITSIYGRYFVDISINQLSVLDFVSRPVDARYIDDISIDIFDIFVLA